MWRGRCQQTAVGLIHHRREGRHITHVSVSCHCPLAPPSVGKELLMSASKQAFLQYVEFAGSPHAQMFSFSGMFSQRTGDLSFMCTCGHGPQHPQWIRIKRRWTEICCEATLPSSKISYLSRTARQASTTSSLSHFKGYLEYFIMFWGFFCFFFSNTILLLAPTTPREHYQSHHLSGKRKKKNLCKENIFFTNVKLFLWDHLDLYDCLVFVYCRVCAPDMVNMCTRVKPLHAAAQHFHKGKLYLSFCKQFSWEWLYCCIICLCTDLFQAHL